MGPSLEDLLRQASEAPLDTLHRRTFVQTAAMHCHRYLVPTRISVAVSSDRSLEPASRLLTELTLLAAGVWNFYLPDQIRFVHSEEAGASDLQVHFLLGTELVGRAGQFNRRSYMRTANRLQGCVRITTDVTPGSSPFALDLLHLLAVAMHEMGHYLLFEDHDVKGCIMYQSRALARCPDAPGVRIIESLRDRQRHLQGLLSLANELQPGDWSPTPSLGETSTLEPIKQVSVARAVRHVRELICLQVTVPNEARTAMLVAWEHSMDRQKAVEADLRSCVAHGFDNHLVRELLAHAAFSQRWETEWDDAWAFFQRFGFSTTATDLMALACRRSERVRGGAFLTGWRKFLGGLTPICTAWYGWSEDSCLVVEAVTGRTLGLHSSLINSITPVIGRAGVGLFRVALALDRRRVKRLSDAGLG